MKSKNCTCTYYKLRERGYEPMDHADTCPLSKGFNLITPKRFIPPKGLNPYKEVDRYKDERDKAKEM